MKIIHYHVGMTTPPSCSGMPLLEDTGRQRGSHSPLCSWDDLMKYSRLVQSYLRLQTTLPCWPFRWLALPQQVQQRAQPSPLCVGEAATGNVPVLREGSLCHWRCTVRRLQLGNLLSHASSLISTSSSK